MGAVVGHVCVPSTVSAALGVVMEGGGSRIEGKEGGRVGMGVVWMW